jgi:uncharacterized lipoprotein
MKNKFMYAVVAALVLVSILSGCMEHHYYQKNNHQHSEQYNHRHHRGNSPGIDINLHN